MYKYHKTYHKSSHICECENRSLLLKGRQRGQKSVLTELDWASPRQSSETAASVASDLAASGIGLVEDRSPIDVDRLPSDGTGLL